MWLSKKELDYWYQRGRRNADAGIPPNFGHRSGDKSRYYEMSYFAGHRDALNDLKALKRRLEALPDPSKGAA